MKLVYQIPDKLYYIQNFLDHSTYKKIHSDVFKSKLVFLKSTKEDWEKDLKHGHKNFVERADLKTNYWPLKKIKILLENNFFHRIKVKNFNPMIHSMNDGCGINWHDDGDYKYGITYYINRRWNPFFGGEFLFRSENSNGFIPIVGNSLVIVKAPLEHKVSHVLNPLIPRKTIQIFIKN